MGTYIPKAEIKIRKAHAADTDAVSELARRTILSVYPRYYPMPVAEWFVNWHRKPNVKKDTDAGNVYVAEADNNLVGTVTIEGNHIARLFVEPAIQGKGIGSTLMDFAESIIAKSHESSVVDSSLPAAKLYEHRGYKMESHGEVEVESEDGNAYILVYETMRKPL